MRASSEDLEILRLLLLLRCDLRGGVRDLCREGGVLDLERVRVKTSPLRPFRSSCTTTRPLGLIDLCTFRFGFLTGSGDEAELLELELGDLFLAFFDTFFKDARDGKGDG